MNGTNATAARRLAERRFEHPLISAFIDLDATRFTSAGARATEVNSLLDQAQHQLHAKPLEHDDRVALAQDIERVGRYLTAELDASGMPGVAVYCCGRESLFETLRLSHQVPSEIVIEPLPRLEPLIPAPEPASVCVALVNRREARFLVSAGDSKLTELRHAEQPENPIHRQHRQGGRSEANYERSIEADVDHHLRRAAERLFDLWRAEPFDRLVLGGPHEVVTRFAPELHPNLRDVLDEAELALDLSAASASEVDDALEPLRQRWRELAQWHALQRLLSTMHARPGTSVGFPDTLAALARRQVESLVLAPRIDDSGAECRRCGQLYAQANGHCDADGAPLTPVRSLRSAMVRAAVLQDADVIVLEDFNDRPELAAFDGVGAILRY